MQKLCGFLACNYILYVPLLSWLAAQICKTIIDLFLTGKLDLERMFGAGGMPSAHSALVLSLIHISAMAAKRTKINDRAGALSCEACFSPWKADGHR